MRNPASTRQRLLEAAIEVFARKGYHGAVVEEIVRASETSKGAFYFHFPSKQDLFLALVDDLVERLSQRVETAIARQRGGVDKVTAALQTVLEAFASHRQIAKILLIDIAGVGPAIDRKLLETHTRLARLIQRHLDRAVAEGDIPPLDTTITAFAWLGAINEVVIRWLYTGQPDPLDRALPTLRALLLRSIGLQPPTEG